MAENVIDFPQEKPPELLVGPFSEWRVVVEGRMIPRLTGYREGENICLVVDHRFSISVPKNRAYDVAWLVANAMAVSAGYPSLGAESKERPFAPIACAVEGTEEAPQPPGEPKEPSHEA